MIQSEKKIYFENLDGLRFVCFMMVFFFHSFYTQVPDILNNPVYRFIKKGIFSNGNLGVNFFFVLSGFLITYLLIKEKERFSKINIPYFWVRRIFRIWPLYFFCVLFGFFVFPFLKTLVGLHSDETAHLWAYLSFTSNFDLIKNGLPDASILGVLWSVAIEEQFYFLWPLLLFAFPVKWYWLPFCSILLGSILFGYFNNTEIMMEYHSLSRMGDLVIGALGAWLCYSSTRFINLLQRLPRWSIYIIYLVFVLVFVLRDEVKYIFPFFTLIERPFIAIVMLLIILEQCFSTKSFYKMSNFKLVSKLGTISYGMYCLHFIGILVTLQLTKLLGINQHVWQVLFIETILSFLITLLIAQISFKYFEQYFLRLKGKFSILNN